MGASLAFAEPPRVADYAFVFLLDKAKKLMQVVAQLPGRGRTEYGDKWFC